MGGGERNELIKAPGAERSENREGKSMGEDALTIAGASAPKSGKTNDGDGKSECSQGRTENSHSDEVASGSEKGDVASDSKESEEQSEEQALEIAMSEGEEQTESGQTGSSHGRSFEEAVAEAKRLGPSPRRER